MKRHVFNCLFGIHLISKSFYRTLNGSKHHLNTINIVKRTLKNSVTMSSWTFLDVLILKHGISPWPQLYEVSTQSGLQDNCQTGTQLSAVLSVPTSCAGMYGVVLIGIFGMCIFELFWLKLVWFGLPRCAAA